MTTTSLPFNFAAVAAQAPAVPVSSAGTGSNNGPSIRSSDHPLHGAIGNIISSVDHSPHSMASSQTSSSLMTSPNDGFSRTQHQVEASEASLKSSGGGLLTTAPSDHSSLSFALKAGQQAGSGRNSQTASSTGTPLQQQQQPQQVPTPTSAPPSSAAALLAAVTSHYNHTMPGTWSSEPITSQASLLPPSGSQQSAMRSARISARQGISPLGKVQLRHEHLWQRKMVEAAFQRVPTLGDSERLRHFLPRQPCAGPGYFPSAPLEGFTSAEFYKRLNLDSLFFIFYFMEGTKAQLLAAQALKDLAWRFHTRELTWFQRAEQPKEVTENYEMVCVYKAYSLHLNNSFFLFGVYQGTYLFFDTQRWQARKRENFRFEYQYLEDRNLSSYLEAAEATAQAAVAANSTAAALMMAAASNAQGAQAGSLSSSGPSSS